MTQCLIDRHRLLLPPSMITIGQIKRCCHTYNGYGAESFNWSDVTYDAATSLSQYQYSDQSYYSDNYYLQFRVPKKRLSWFTPVSVKLHFHATAVNRSCPLYVYVTDADETESGSYLSNTISASGWHEIDITSRFNSEIADVDDVWYVIVMIGYYSTISYNTQYTVTMNTLYGDYDPYITLEY